MSLLEWLTAIFLIGILSLFALLVVVGIMFILIGAFAKGYDKTREEIIHARYRK